LSGCSVFIRWLLTSVRLSFFMKEILPFVLRSATKFNGMMRTVMVAGKAGRA